MALILPNAIANQQPADGDKIDQNFDTIQNWANQEAITRDGSTAMTSPLLLPGAPTAPNQAATKDYVDNNIPIATMWMTAADAAPTGWMLCRGQAISRATYAPLFTAIGTRFGVGDGTTTFNLPDMRGVYPFGHNEGGTYGQVGVGQRFGNKDSTLPSHQHPGVDHLHPFSGGTGGATARHTHGFPEGYFFHQTANPQFYVHVTGGGGFDVAADIFNFASWGTTNDQQDHAHGFSGTTGAADRSLTTGAAGVDGTNGNLPPSVSLNFMMKVQ